MRRICPKCSEKSVLISNYGRAREHTSDDVTYKSRGYVCKNCGYRYRGYEFLVYPEQKEEIIKLIHLGRQFLEFKVEWKKAIEAEREARRQKQAEYQEERKRQRAIREARMYGADYSDEVLEDLDYFTEEGDEEDE